MLTIAVALFAASPVAADQADYAELAPASLLPPIIAELKRTLADPYSIRDFVMCPPRRIKMKDGRPTSWQVSIAFNSKNSFGGYTGFKTYSVLFRDGLIRGGVMATQFARSDGIEGLLNSITTKQVVNCPPVSDDLLQELLSPGASPLKEVR